MREVSQGFDLREPTFIAASRGDEAAFRRLLDELERDLWSFCRARVHESELEDVMQEVRIALWKALPDYQGKSKFKTWAFGIAYNKVMDALRKSARRNSLPVDQNQLELEAAFIEPTPFESSQTLWAIVEQLPRHQAEIVELHYRFGFTLNEISELVGRNVNTVKYTLCQAYVRMGSLARKQGWLGD